MAVGELTPLRNFYPTAPLSYADRVEIGDIVAHLIEVLDLNDGDPDLEPNGDELDGSMGEDDFHNQNENWRGHPGCPISDPGEDDGDNGRVPEYGIDQTNIIPDIFVVQAERDGMIPHRDRIRETRCDRLPRPDFLGRTHSLRRA